MYVNSYDLAVEGDSLITLKTVSGALNTSKEKYELKKKTTMIQQRLIL